jgi:hypothetical protein
VPAPADAEVAGQAYDLACGHADALAVDRAVQETVDRGLIPHEHQGVDVAQVDAVTGKLEVCRLPGILDAFVDRLARSIRLDAIRTEDNRRELFAAGRAALLTPQHRCEEAGGDLRIGGVRALDADETDVGVAARLLQILQRLTEALGRFLHVPQSSRSAPMTGNEEEFVPGPHRPLQPHPRACLAAGPATVSGPDCLSRRSGLLAIKVGSLTEEALRERHDEADLDDQT